MFMINLYLNISALPSSRGSVKNAPDSYTSVMDAAAAIKERLGVEDVVAEYVTLKRAGRNFKGLCPFHSEKTPSFMVNPERGIYHCFGCNEGGDILSFVMKMEGLDFRGALELLARKSGVDLAQYGGTSSAGNAQRKEELTSLLDLTAKYYQTTLVKNQRALNYAVKDRRLAKKTIETFRIGYAPDAGGTALVDFLLKRGHKQTLIKEAGLVTSTNSRRDLFRGRLILPLCDPQGRVIGFTGRSIDPESKGPKYLNSPQTLVYDKSRNIFGLHLAKQAIRESDRAVLVEGNLDVVSSHQAGVTNVVATAGTALTIEQLKQLSRLASTVILAFDADAAGVKATIRAIELAQKVTLTLMVAPMQGGKDPDELIRRDVKLWKDLLDKPIYAIDWLFSHYASQFDLTSAQGKRQMSAALLPLLQQLADPVEQEHYMKLLAKKLDVSVEAVKRQVSGKTTTLRRSKAAESPREHEANLLLDTYLSLLVRYPESRVSMAGSKLPRLGEQRERLWEYLF